MKLEQVGATIAYLRKRAGFTQRDLAERIGISDKAVSKWERGLSLPDISSLEKLSTLLSIDQESLLNGITYHHDSSWGGLIYLPLTLNGIELSTIVYDKPLVYYLLSNFLLVGITKIIIVGSKTDNGYLEEKFGSGGVLGIKLTFCDINAEIEFIQSKILSLDVSNIMLSYGRFFLFGSDQSLFYQRAMSHKDRNTILALPNKALDKNIIHFTEDMQIVNINNPNAVQTQCDYSSLPFFFCGKSFCSSFIKSLKNLIFSDNDLDLYVVTKDRGYFFSNLDNIDDVIDVANFVSLIQKKAGMKFFSLEEIAWRRGYITHNQLIELAKRERISEYRAYLLGL